MGSHVLDRRDSKPLFAQETLKAVLASGSIGKLTRQFCHDCFNRFLGGRCSQSTTVRLSRKGSRLVTVEQSLEKRGQGRLGCWGTLERRQPVGASLGHLPAVKDVLKE